MEKQAAEIQGSSSGARLSAAALEELTASWFRRGEAALDQFLARISESHM